MEFFLVTWLFCAIACAVIASAKGKSAGAWLFWGLMFGIFALIAVAFSTRESVSATPNDAPLVLDKSTGLLVVGTPQPVPPCVLGQPDSRWGPNGMEQINSPQPTMKSCPYCAEEVKFEAIKCKHCQSELSVQAGA